MPKGKVYLDEKFIGISMDYYQDYITLGKSLETKQDSYKKRLILCKKIVEALKKLHNNGICHNDIHLDNIIYNPKLEDAVLIDIDGGTPKEFLLQKEYQRNINNDKYNLLVVILSYLYQFDFESFHLIGATSLFKNVLNCFPVGENFKNYISDFQNQEDISLEYIDTYFSEMKEPTDNKIKWF